MDGLVPGERLNLRAGDVWPWARLGRSRNARRVADGELETSGAGSARRGWALGLAVAVTIGAFLLMSRAGLDGLLRPPPAPLPELAFERVAFEPGEVIVSVRNTGREALLISQVTVDGAYWQFRAEPGPRLGRLGTARLHVPYPWMAGEPLEVTIVDSAGTTFTETVPLAAATPASDGRTVAGYVLLGTYVGVVPVFLGLLFLPALARLGRSGVRFLLGVTGGLLLFLAIEAGGESLELAGRLPPVLHGTALVVAGAGGTFAALAFLAGRGRRRRSEAPRGGDAGQGGPPPLRLAYLVAVGIGLHNFGEGLAVGSAQARGEVALGAVLLVGFALHNLTEGIGIAAPTLGHGRPGLRQLLLLGAVAGLPTIAGALVGGLAYSTVLAVVFLAVGVGAIAEVVAELSRFARRGGGPAGALLGGAAAGFALMYTTALAIGG